jgi:hypothetical protein
MQSLDYIVWFAPGRLLENSIWVWFRYCDEEASSAATA